jgi:hypothetical protein
MTTYSSAEFAAARRLTFVCEDPAPKTLGAPDTRTQAFELDDLAVIHKEVYFRTVVLDIPRKDFRIRCFKHWLLQSQSVDNPGDHISAPRFHILGYAL